MKPENIFINNNGYLKIVDLGLSRENIKKYKDDKSFCGTPEYRTPEIIEGKGYGQAADWWSLGAIIYEMLTGIPPFYNKNREKLFYNIKIDQLKSHKYLSKEAIDLLERLFIKDPDKRLGCGPNGSQDIKSHPFFAKISWEDILDKKIMPPFMPELRRYFDPKYFDLELDFL